MWSKMLKFRFIEGNVFFGSVFKSKYFLVGRVYYLRDFINTKICDLYSIKFNNI